MIELNKRNDMLLKMEKWDQFRKKRQHQIEKYVRLREQIVINREWNRLLSIRNIYLKYLTAFSRKNQDRKINIRTAWFLTELKTYYKIKRKR